MKVSELMTRGVVGMPTDRDICMAGDRQGKPYAAIPVSTAMAKPVFGVSEDDLIDTAEALMREKPVRRFPVLNGEGKQMVEASAEITT